MHSANNLSGDKFSLMSKDESPVAATLRISSLLLLIESAFIFALGIYMVALGFTHDKAWMPYLSVIAFAFVGSAALFLLARGVKDGKRWAISPAILANLIALGVAKYQFEAGAVWLAVPITAIAIAVIVALMINFKNLER